MAEERSSNSSSKKPVEKEQEQEGPRESTPASKEEERVQTYEAGWLQLGIAATASASSMAERGGSMELQLFPERPPPMVPTPAASTAASTSYGIGRLGWRPESSGSQAEAAPVAAEDLRVVNRPQRVRAGIWIALRPAENQ